MTIRIEKLAVDLVANGQRFKKELDTSQSVAENWGRRVGSTITKSTAVIGAAVTATSLLANRTIRLADEISKNSKAAGLSVEVYQSWEFAASQAGVSNEKFSASMERATKRIGEAARGYGGAKKTLDEYGISIFDTKGHLKSTDSVVREFSDRLKGMQTAAERTAAVTALFGREGIRMGQVFGQGADVLSQFEERAEKLGLVIDRGVLEKAEKANDQLDIMQRIIKSRLIGSMSVLFPTVISVGNSFAAATPKIIEFTEAASNLLFNTDKAQISNKIKAARDQIKVLRDDIELIDLGSLTSVSPLSRNAIGDIDLGTSQAEAVAKARLRKAIELRKTLIEGGHKELKELIGRQTKIQADLINAGALSVGSSAAGGSGSVAGKKAKSYEELQAEATEQSYARRFNALSDYTQKYLERTAVIVEADKKAAEEREKAESALRDARISIAEDVFGTLGGLAKEDSKAQRGLFALQKAGSLARSAGTNTACHRP